MPKDIEPRSELDFDEASGLGFIRFFDSDGSLLDGSGGLDCLLSGFQHGQKQVRLSPRYADLLALVAEYGGRWMPRQGFAIREDGVPDLKRALQAYPQAIAPAETARARDIRADGKPLVIAQEVELGDDETLFRTAQFVGGNSAEKVPAEEVVRQSATKTWVRVGSRFYRRPELTDKEIEDAPRMHEAPLRGDDVPFFFAKQLAQLQQGGGRVLLGPRAAKASVVDSDWLPDLSVALNDQGRLKLGVTFRTGSFRITQGQVQASKRRAYIPVADGTWVRNDKATQATVTEALKRIPDMTEIPDALGYEAPAFTLPLIQETFAAVGTVNLAESAQAFRRKLEDFEQIERAQLPHGLKATLRPYQQSGYDWLTFLRRYGLRGVLADDMGLGKTLQALAIILAEMESGAREPALVVCPASVTNVWKAEIEKWCVGVLPWVLTGSNREAFFKTPWPRTIAITSYSMIARNADSFKQITWSYVVLDEAHRIKNPSAVSTKACKGLLSRHRLAVTGTPIQNRLIELWSIFDFLMPKYLGTATRFQREYEVPITSQQDQEAASRLRKRVDPFKLRRVKQQVAKDLPPLTQQVLQVAMVEPQQQMYDQIVRDTAPALIKQLKGGASSSIQVLEKLLRLRQVAAHPKLLDAELPLDDMSGKFESMKETLEDAVEDGQKVLVFSQWTSMANLITRYLDARNIKYAYLDGKTPTQKREAVVAGFQSPSGPQVMVLSLLAGGEGITLTEASIVILFDRWWNPALEDQAIARAHRIGQSVPVTAYILEAKGTIEERLADLLRRKKALSSEIISVDEAEKRISKDDLLTLLQEELTAAQAE